MSWLRSAPRTRASTRPSSSAAVGEPDRSTRTGRALAKQPITRSVCPDRRPSTAAHPASSVVDSVAPWRPPSALSPAVTSPSSSSRTAATAWSGCAARGRSVGSSSGSGVSAGVSCPYSACSRSSPPSITVTDGDVEDVRPASNSIDCFPSKDLART